MTRGKQGFWHLQRDSAGVWWLISPDDRREFLNTVTNVHPFQLGRDPAGANYLSRDWNGGSDENENPGEMNAWARRTIERIKAAGFKGLGAWCHRTFHEHDVPISRDLNLWHAAKEPYLRFFSPEWPTIAEESVRTQVEPLRENRNLVGYFTDNELPWNGELFSLRSYFDNLSADDPNRVAAIQVIRAAWTDAGGIEGCEVLPELEPRLEAKLQRAWRAHLAERYFALTSALVRKHDPNHLILGVRFAGRPPREVAAASRDHTDAQSVNIYASNAMLDRNIVQMLNEVTQQPVIVSEYSFHALDGRSGNRDNYGFAWGHVIDQQARADGYRLMTTRLARLPYVVGADWFQWNDEPPAGRGGDGEDVNFGVVDIHDREYEPLVAAIQEATPRLNDLHVASVADKQSEIWQPALPRPSFDVPFVGGGKQPARLTNLLLDPAIGVERSKQLIEPDVRLGWTRDGLHLSIDVTDTEIHGIPPVGAMAKDERWRRFDHIAFYVRTRAAEEDLEWFDEFTHEFFYVPSADGDGVVGQWHHPGDAIRDHRVPHERITQRGRRTPRGYSVELLISADALHGFDPQQHSVLVANLIVRNWQDAIEYQWAGPSHTPPGRWGRLNPSKP